MAQIKPDQAAQDAQPLIVQPAEYLGVFILYLLRELSKYIGIAALVPRIDNATNSLGYRLFVERRAFDFGGIVFMRHRWEPYSMCSTTASPNSEHLSSVAPSISRSKS